MASVRSHSSSLGATAAIARTLCLHIGHPTLTTSIAGPLSQWLYGALRECELPVELLETRHVKAALSAMPVKTDRNDARGLAQLMRLGWFRPVHCKSMAAQEVRALLTARKLVQSKLYDIE